MCGHLRTSFQRSISCTRREAGAFAAASRSRRARRRAHLLASMSRVARRGYASRRLNMTYAVPTKATSHNATIAAPSPASEYIGE